MDPHLSDSMVGGDGQWQKHKHPQGNVGAKGRGFTAHSAHRDGQKASPEKEAPELKQTHEMSRNSLTHREGPDGHN